MSPAEQTRQFFTAYPKRSYDKGEVLIQAGQAPPGIFYLIEGRVGQYDIDQAGDKLILNVFKAGAFFPMSWALNRAENRHFFEALETARVHLCPADEAVDFLQTNPAVMQDLLKRVYRGTDGLLRRVAQLMGGSARSRTIYELYVAGYRFGSPGANGSLDLHLSETELATMAGLARETFNRELQKLKSEGHVKVAPKRITIQDIDALEKLLYM